MENDKFCKNCKNFRLHYIRYSRGNYSALTYGHCVKPRLKKRYADTNACEHWQEKETSPAYRFKNETRLMK